MELKRLVARLPLGQQQALKRWRCARQIRRGTFWSLEPEFHQLGAWVRPGDWVVDVGANIGHYTVRLGQLVGPTGRVIAFEPILESVELLASNVRAADLRNVTILQLAAGTEGGMVGFAIPRFATGLENYYQAHRSEQADRQVLTARGESLLRSGHRIAFVKIDVEGHEMAALEGLDTVLWHDRPVLLVEDNDPAVQPWLRARSYDCRQQVGSPNRVYVPRGG